MAATATKLSAGPVMAAIYAALNVTAITTTLACGVYDDVPRDAAFPYIHLSTPSGIPWDTFGSAGKQRVLQVHIYSTYEGGTEANSIADKVMELLQYQALSVSGHTLCGLQYESDTDASYEDDGGVKVVHRVVSFRVTVQEA